MVRKSPPAVNWPQVAQAFYGAKLITPLSKHVVVVGAVITVVEVTISVESAEVSNSLGILTKSASGSPELPDYAGKYAMQAESRKLLPDSRVSICHRMPVAPHGKIEVKKREDVRGAFYMGLARCDSIWTCPVCAARITEHRRKELKKATETTGLTPIMITYTIQHNRDMSLSEVLKGLKDSYRAVKSGRWYQWFTNQFDVSGSVRAIEVTFGFDTGWHPHIHELILTNALPLGLIEPAERMPALDSYTASIDLALSQKWQDVARRNGCYATLASGVQVTHGANGKDIASYVQKYGKLPSVKWGAADELTKASSKTLKGERLSPFGLLARSIETANPVYGEKFKEYAHTMHGTRQLYFSSGTLELLGLKDTPDAAIEETLQYSAFAAFDHEQWSYILKHDMRSFVLEIAACGTPSDLEQALYARTDFPGIIDTRL